MRGWCKPVLCVALRCGRIWWVGSEFIPACPRQPTSPNHGGWLAGWLGRWVGCHQQIQAAQARRARSRRKCRPLAGWHADVSGWGAGRANTLCLPKATHLPKTQHASPTHHSQHSITQRPHHPIPSQPEPDRQTVRPIAGSAHGGPACHPLQIDTGFMVGWFCSCLPKATPITTCLPTATQPSPTRPCTAEVEELTSEIAALRTRL